MGRLDGPQRGKTQRVGTIIDLDVSKIFVGDVNVRKSPGDVSDLVESIREEGILEPVVTRPVGMRYELIVGSRRFEAAKIIGL